MKYHILQISLTNAEVDLINKEGHNAVARHARHLNDRYEYVPDILIHDYDHVANIEANSLAEVVDLSNADIDRNNHPQIDIVIDNPEQGLASISEGDIIINSETLNCYYDTGYKFRYMNVKPEELKSFLSKTVSREWILKREKDTGKAYYGNPNPK